MPVSGDWSVVCAGNGRAFAIRVFTLGHVRTFSITMSPDITCIKNGTITCPYTSNTCRDRSGESLRGKVKLWSILLYKPWPSLLVFRLSTGGDLAAQPCT